jgi:hypothetical protein
MEDKIWMVNQNGAVQGGYGWFETIEECEAYCIKKAEQYKHTNMWFTPYGVQKGRNSDD